MVRPDASMAALVWPFLRSDQIRGGAGMGLGALGDRKKVFFATDGERGSSAANSVCAVWWWVSC